MGLNLIIGPAVPERRWDVSGWKDGTQDLGGSKGFLRAGEMKEIYLIVELRSNRETKQKRSFHTVGLSCVKTRGHTTASHIYHTLIECVGMVGTCVRRLGTLRR